jgi:cytochrome c-type biogenesis protein
MMTTTVLLPIALGLLGFLEPCSLGANILFLNLQAKVETARRVREALVFTGTRALFLGSLGALGALAAQPLARAQAGYSLILGAFYIALGLASLAGPWNWALPPAIDPGQLLARWTGRAAPLGVIFGLTAPACAAPLFLALVGQAGPGGAARGFMMLGLFGLALSAPLVVIAASGRAGTFLHRLRQWAGRAPAVAGIVLIGLGILSIIVAWGQMVSK